MIINELIQLISEYTLEDANMDASLWKTQITKTVNAGLPLRLISFTCSTIQSEYLFSDTPWLYVDTNVQGNNLEPDMERLGNIIARIRTVYPVQLDIIIGNTDPYYIYLQQFANWNERQKTFLWKQFRERWTVYKNSLQAWLDTTYPALKANVLSWDELEKNIENRQNINFEQTYEYVYKNILMYVDQEDLAWEFRQLETQFGPDKYFTKLRRPADRLLKDWIRRKFAEYAVQGKWLYDYFSPCILIQNEKPSILRSKMYQPLIQEDKLPIVYFFGVDNSGYQ